MLFNALKIGNNNILLFRFGQDEQVFIVLFHPILFPGIFLQGTGIGPQLFQLLFCVFDLAQEIITAFFQLVEFVLVLKVGSNNILVIEETNPYTEHQGGEEVLIF